MTSPPDWAAGPNCAIGKNKLLVAATDLNVSLVAEHKSTNTTEGGLTVSAKKLHELLSSAP